ncbi:MarR family winged helix-turn-helix transcriptional regulator [Haloplasma contractile]|uniref:MarR-family transcriptional regulator protein n=1 Tax=Haloplasma contractile SSD-17B TaxID=1033810 RepID=U2FET2_9MOLU|nr:MarR family transcriptional regulator [Haloplasma contractile]ERJ11450.1 MarR-family transcriptional regulator protein [Haloplasma contractile SSD-17B]
MTDFLNKIGDAFFEFEARLQFYERKYLRTHKITDITPNEVKVLYVIGISNTKSMGEIAEKLKVTLGTLTTAVNSLVKKGYVIRTRNKMDRRIKILYLTRKSIEAVKVYSNFYTSILGNLVNELDADETETVNKILKIMISVLDDDRLLQGLDDNHE